MELAYVVHYGLYGQFQLTWSSHGFSDVVEPVMFSTSFEFC